MPFRSFLYRLIWSLGLALALFGARSAQAAAPICDERGASAIAPPPVLPIRDVRAEAASPSACLDFDVVGTAVVPSGPHGAPSAESAVVDAWIGASTVPLFRAVRTRSPFFFDSFALPPGHRRSVFRPPRV